MLQYLNMLCQTIPLCSRLHIVFMILIKLYAETEYEVWAQKDNARWDRLPFYRIFTMYLYIKTSMNECIRECLCNCLIQSVIRIGLISIKKVLLSFRRGMGILAALLQSFWKDLSLYLLTFQHASILSMLHFVFFKQV